MSFWITIKTAFKSMTSNKVRTGLTVLGVVIGIASVIIVYSAGEGLNGLILSQIESFGTDFIETEVKVPSGKKGYASESESGSNLAQGVQITTLTLSDMEEINKFPNIVDSYSAIIGQELAGYQNEQKKAMIYGVSASYIDIDPSEIGEGRFFTEAEDKSLARVTVLGIKMKDKLFGDSEAIGNYITLHKTKYLVIGVMKERGAVMTLDFDDVVYLPVRTLQKRVMGIDHVLYMVHKVADMDRAEETAEDIRFLLRDLHDIGQPDDPKDISRDDFRVSTMAEMMDMLGTITGALTLLLLAIVAISIVVGGVGIMNIMYVIVSERTAEIGLRKAVGAKYKDIMLQILLESILITLVGGVVGILTGVLVAFLISVGANYKGFDWRFGIPLKAYIVSLSFSAVFGILFGIYPARKAAKMEPVEALRKE